MSLATDDPINASVEACSPAESHSQGLEIDVEGWPAEWVDDLGGGDGVLDAPCTVVAIADESSPAVLELECADAGEARKVTLTIANAAQRFPLCEGDAVTIDYRYHLVGVPNGGAGEAFDLLRADDDVLLASRRSYVNSEEPVVALPGTFDALETELGCAPEGDPCVMETRGGVLVAEGDDNTWIVAGRTMRKLPITPAYVFYAEQIFSQSSELACETLWESSYDLTLAEE